MKYIQHRRLDIQKYDQVMDMDNHITIGDFESNRINPRECHENAYLFLEAHRAFVSTGMTPEQLQRRLLAVESMLKQCLNAITGNEPIQDSRGVVYTQEFGIAFVNQIKKALDLNTKPLFAIADKLPFHGVLDEFLNYSQNSFHAKRTLILKATTTYRKCKAAGKFKLAQKINDKYNLGNPVNSLR